MGARRRTARALAWAPLGLALACASGGAPLPGTRPDPAPAAPAASAAPAVSGLVLTVEPADAELVVNGAPRGNVSALPGGLLPLAPGRYRLSLRRPGYATWRAEVSVQRGIDPLRVELAPADAGGSP